MESPMVTERAARDLVDTVTILEVFDFGSNDGHMSAAIDGYLHKEPFPRHQKLKPHLSKRTYQNHQSLLKLSPGLGSFSILEERACAITCSQLELLINGVPEGNSTLGQVPTHVVINIASNDVDNASALILSARQGMAKYKDDRQRVFVVLCGQEALAFKDQLLDSTWMDQHSTILPKEDGALLNLLKGIGHQSFIE